MIETPNPTAVKKRRIFDQRGFSVVNAKSSHSIIAIPIELDECPDGLPYCDVQL
jgi:hypothetical protein